jgi:ATP-dependent DNA helicase PIF1
MESFSPEQKTVFQAFQDGHSLFMTGAGGCGKSYLIRHMVNYAHEHNKSIAVCAMTGCASIVLNCNATTLHSWAGIGIAEEENIKIVSRMRVNRSFKAKMARDRWKTTNILIVDEVSMMSQKIFELIEMLGRTFNNPFVSFGGIQVIFSGDFYQLPPVNKSSEKTQFCFESELWNELFGKHQYELTHIYRQTDDEFVKILMGIRHGTITKKGVKKLMSRVEEYKKLEDTMENVVYLFPMKYQVDEHNESKQKLLSSETEHIYDSYIDILNIRFPVTVWDTWKKDTNNPPEEIITHKLLYRLTIDDKMDGIVERSSLSVGQFFKKDSAMDNLMKGELLKTKTAEWSDVYLGLEQIVANKTNDKSLKLRLGSQVMLTMNMLDMGLCNGSVGKVVDFQPSVKYKIDVPIVEFDNKVKIHIDPQIITKESIKGISLYQMPLILAYAVSIHKIQGATIDKAVINCGERVFESGQAYVALSRVRSLEGLYLSDFSLSSIKTSKKVKDFYNKLTV